jgi:hypothetical protein
MAVNSATMIVIRMLNARWDKCEFRIN